MEVGLRPNSSTTKSRVEAAQFLDPDGKGIGRRRRGRPPLCARRAEQRQVALVDQVGEDANHLALAIEHWTARPAGREGRLVGFTLDVDRELALRLAEARHRLRAGIGARRTELDRKSTRLNS